MKARWIVAFLFVAAMLPLPGLAAATPRFAPQAPGDDNWSALDGGVGGTDDEVFALAVDGTGALYAGGAFHTAGGVPANCVARWDGSAWSALGSGTGGPYGCAVYALAVDGRGALYAGGTFTTAGGVPASHIARWDGSAWSALGSGMNDSVYTLAVDGSGNLYAGGYFHTAGGVPVNFVARWDGSAWSALRGGMAGSYTQVDALVVAGSGTLYAGGNFTTAGGVPANYVARWDGSAWSALGSGVNEPVRALTVDDSGNLYAGGRFFSAGGVPANRVARWDGSAWSALGSGMDNDVVALALDGSKNLYAGGYFTEAGGVRAHHVALWDGSAWNILGRGVNYPVDALAADGSGNLYAGGYFTEAGRVLVNHVARWTPPVSLHLYRLKVAWGPAPSGYRLFARGSVHDQDQILVPSVRVHGRWTAPDGSVVNKAALTNAQGKFRLTLRTSQAGAWQFCVVNMAKEGYVYDPGSNHTDPCRTFQVGP